MRTNVSFFSKLSLSILLFTLSYESAQDPHTVSDDVSESDSVVVHFGTSIDKYAGCSFETVFRDSIHFNTPPALPIGYLKAIERDVLGNFVVGSLGQHIMIFDPNGSFLWSVGRFGMGPGEYSNNYIFGNNIPNYTCSFHSHTTAIAPTTPNL